MHLHAEWAVTMVCGDACPYGPTTVEERDFPDPAERPVEEVRTFRDAIELRVRELVDTKLHAIRSDRTGHQLRLAQLLPALDEQIIDRGTPEDIRARADATLTRDDDAPSRSRGLAVARHQICHRLGADTCDAVAT
jgi:hypothetical protein